MVIRMYPSLPILGFRLIRFSEICWVVGLLDPKEDSQMCEGSMNDLAEGSKVNQFNYPEM